MARKCSVVSCKHGYKRPKRPVSAHMFPFPKDDRIKKLWLKACGLSVNTEVKHKRVCTVHFLDTDYVRDLKAELLGCNPVKRLKEYAVPSIGCVDYSSDSSGHGNILHDNYQPNPENEIIVHDNCQSIPKNEMIIRYSCKSNPENENILNGSCQSNPERVVMEVYSDPEDSEGFNSLLQAIKKVTYEQCHHHPPNVKDVSTSTDEYACLDCPIKKKELNDCKDALKPIMNYPRTADMRLNLMQKQLEAVIAENRNLKRKIKYAFEKASKDKQVFKS